MRMKGRLKAVKRSATASTSSYPGEVEEEILIRKGPWKAEEDEVLLKHVSKYGPRDWSSLLSKGLLQRTGKSCRLRWVNKLRPNLKNGCKFSADEERIVIELQAQLGNKWARIATYLPGRTDNDVKNFWSSRQKRLARILLNSQQQNAKSKPNRILTNFTSLPSQGLELDSPVVESSSNAESSTSLHYTGGAIEAVPLHTVIPNNAFVFAPNTISNSQETICNHNVISMDQQKNTECSILQQQNLSFPDPPSDLQLLLPNAHEEIIENLDLDFMSAFPGADNPITSGAIVGHGDDHHGLMQLSLDMANYLGPLEAATSFNDQQVGGEIKAERGVGNDLLFDPNSLTPERFFDDLPSDIFDQMDQLPSPPSDW